MRMLRSICNQASEQNIASLNTRELFENVFIGKDMRLEQVSLRKTDLVKELLEFYMGKNTMERQNFIINNLVIEEDLAS